MQYEKIPMPDNVQSTLLKGEPVHIVFVDSDNNPISGSFVVEPRKETKE